jgi:hypothetical protein
MGNTCSNTKAWKEWSALSQDVRLGEIALAKVESDEGNSVAIMKEIDWKLKEFLKFSTLEASVKERLITDLKAVAVSARELAMNKELLILNIQNAKNKANTLRLTHKLSCPVL